MNEENGRVWLSENDFEKEFARLSAEIDFRMLGENMREVFEKFATILEPIIGNIKILFGALVASVDGDNDYESFLAMLREEAASTKRMRLEELKEYRQDFGNIAYTKGRLFKSQVQLNKPKFVQARSRL